VINRDHRSAKNPARLARAVLNRCGAIPLPRHFAPLVAGPFRALHEQLAVKRAALAAAHRRRPYFPVGGPCRSLEIALSKKQKL